MIFYREIRECLKLDPEHKDCFPFYKKLKKIAKLIEEAERAQESGDSENCVDKANKVLKLETSVENVRFTAFQLLCKCYTSTIEVDLAIKNCGAAVDLQKNVDTLCDRAEAYLAADQFDDGKKCNSFLKLQIFTCFESNLFNFGNILELLF